MRGDAELLRLVLRRQPLESVEDWERLASAVEDEGERQTRGPRASELLTEGLPSRLDRVVPYLPEYSAAVVALVEFCYYRYPSETNEMLVRWIHNGNVDRRWLLDWIERSRLLEHLRVEDDISKECKEKWHEAIFIAALNENEDDIRRRFLLLLDKLGDFRDDKEELVETQQLVDHFQIKSSVTALLDFCWQNAFVLSRFALLCAAKIRRVFEQQLSSLPLGVGLPDREEVAARMRWSLLTRPVLFEPLLKHLLMFGVFTDRSDVTNAYFVTYPTDSMQRTASMILRQQTSLRRLNNLVGKLEAAYDTKAVYLKLDSLHHATLLSESKSEKVDLVHSTTAQLMDEFEEDLDDVPTHLFPYVLLAFAHFVHSVSQKPQFDIASSSLRLLFDLFDRRGGIKEQFQVLAVVFDLHAARFSGWKTIPDLYVDVCERLYASSQLQVESKARWAAQIALQQLLFECDPSVLEANATALSAFLPDRLLRLVHIRVRASIK